MPRMPEQAFRRYDETPDEEFYSVPRLVTHRQRYGSQNNLNCGSALC